MGNDQSNMHEPKPPDEQPVRSALSRSRSIRSDANCLGKSQIENKYLPPSSHRQTNALLKHQSMPTYTMNHVEPFSSGTGGYDSPQWGWYINTTPPSPDMYFTSRPTKSLKLSGASISESSADSTSTSVAVSNAPNPVWCSLHDKHKAAPMGWPSVPL
jgi:hypothetical protein